MRKRPRCSIHRKKVVKKKNSNKKKQSKTLISFIKRKLRAASLANPARNEIKRLAKVAPATFACNHCGCFIYEGKSEKNLKQLEKDFPRKKFKQESVQVDHIQPVAEGKGIFTWDDYIGSLFCEVDNLQCLCQDCHEIKSEKDKVG